MDALHAILDAVDSFVWGPFLIVLIVGTGLFISVRLKFLQLRKLRTSVRIIAGEFDRHDDRGEITHFEALATALSATVGVGNIAGVGTAIASGGPGAIFWLWVTGAVGMATKCAECTLAVKFRDHHADGSVSGGPMYTIRNGLGEKWRPLAALFALFTAIAAFGIGNMVQSNSTADAAASFATSYFGVVDADALLGVKAAVGLALAALAGITLIGGIKRIGAVTSRLSPFMCVLYVAGGLAVLVLNAPRVPHAFALIFEHAFTPAAAAGGFAGAAVMQAIRFGVARGTFSNEAGLGSAPMAHAAARTEEPAREGLVALMEPFIDTLCVCSITALAILSTDAWLETDLAGKGLSGASLSAAAFREGLPLAVGGVNLGELLVTVGIMLFASSTVISWYYYGDRAILYLLGPKAIRPYQVVYVALIFVGAVVKLEAVWTFSDIANALMALPNLLSLVLLSGVVAAEFRGYFERHPDQ